MYIFFDFDFQRVELLCNVDTMINNLKCAHVHTVIAVQQRRRGLRPYNVCPYAFRRCSTVTTSIHEAERSRRKRCRLHLLHKHRAEIPMAVEGLTTGTVLILYVSSIALKLYCHVRRTRCAPTCLT